MDGLFSWLGESPSLLESVVWVILFVPVTGFCSGVLDVIVRQVFPVLSKHDSIFRRLPFLRKAYCLNVRGVFLGGIVFEEVQSRLLPIWLVLHFGGRNRIAIIAVVLASSLLFGLHHDFAPRQAIVKGFGGIMFCLLFLKCGGFHGYYVQAVLATSTAHFLCNSFSGFAEDALERGELWLENLKIILNLK